MEIENVDVESCFLLHCTSCGFNAWAMTMGRAEGLAVKHIERYDEARGYPNFNHVIRITSEKLVGREPYRGLKEGTDNET